MAERQYWFVPFSGENWRTFTVCGSRNLTFGGQAAHRSADVRPGDYLLCGLMGISRFVGILSVLDVDRSEHLTGPQASRCRLTVKPLIVLTPETGLPAVELRDCLGCFHAPSHPHGWMKYFWRSFVPWKADDGESVVSALLKIRQHPVKRALGAGMLATRPRAFDAVNQLLTVPHDGHPGGDEPLVAANRPGAVESRDGLIQAFFLKLGRTLGFETWISARDRQCKIGGRPLGMWPGVQPSLQLPMEGVARSVLETMDVLWLKDEQAAAAFAIERNGSLLVALLDIADFLALQPDAHIPFYLAAPDCRRPDVIRQINRAAFAALPLPAAEACRFISFNTVYRTIPGLKTKMPHLTSAILLEISESCEPMEV